MMELRQMTAAFLFNGDKVLMIKKPGSRLFNFEFWSSVGGHIEPDEINSPRNACLREVFEETGIQEHEITDMKLKYILLRMKDGEIRQHFIYFGKTATQEVISSEEGELYWITKNDVPDLHVPTTIKYVLQHYFANPGLEEVTVGTLTRIGDDEPGIQWTKLIDPFIF